MDTDTLIPVDSDLRRICSEIRNEQKSLAEWSEIESDDMFQLGAYDGGFNADEKEFVFSCRLPSGKELWFQLGLDTVLEISNGNDFEIHGTYPST